jgi:4-amino-4-deoxy-L-arabinose transferase-like glycosyltransferase
MKSLSSSPEKIFILIGIIYFSSCSIALFTVTPAMDTLYYWDWGCHMALSYFDGPPMVAYVFAGFTYFFGNTIISVNALSILSSFLIIVPIYALAKKMFDTRVAFFSVWIWLLTLFTFQKFTTGFSYDTPVTFFWALTAYFFLLRI